MRTLTGPSKNIWTYILGLTIAISLINFFWVDAIFTFILLWGIYCAVWKKNFSIADNFNFRLTITNFAIILFFLSGILGYLLASPMGPEQRNDIYNLRWALGFYIFYFAGKSARKNNNTLSYFAAPVLLVLVYILIKHWSFAGHSLLNSQIRLQAFYENPNHFALTIVLFWAFLAATLFIKFNNNDFKFRNIVNKATLFAASIALLATYSRSAWTGAIFAIVLGAILVRKKSAFYKVLAGGIVALSAILLNIFSLKDRLIYSLDMSPASSQQLRFTAWKAAWQIFLDHPLFGVGFAENARLFPAYYAKLGLPADHVLGNTHNQYLEILTGAGIIGLTAYLSIFTLGFVFFYRKFRSTKNDEQFLALGSLLLIAALMASSLTDTPFRLHESRNFIMILLGFSYGYLDSRKTLSE